MRESQVLVTLDMDLVPDLLGHLVTLYLPSWGMAMLGSLWIVTDPVCPMSSLNPHSKDLFHAELNPRLPLVSCGVFTAFHRSLPCFLLLPSPHRPAPCSRFSYPRAFAHMFSFTTLLEPLPGDLLVNKDPAHCPLLTFPQQSQHHPHASFFPWSHVFLGCSRLRRGSHCLLSDRA